MKKGVPAPADCGSGVWDLRRILKATERSFLHLGLYADALSSSNSVSCHIWGGKAVVLIYALMLHSQELRHCQSVELCLETLHRGLRNCQRVG